MGHILRMPKDVLGRDRLVQHAVSVQFEHGITQNLLQNAPVTETFAALQHMVGDRKEWKLMRNRYTANAPVQAQQRQGGHHYHH